MPSNIDPLGPPEMSVPNPTCNPFVEGGLQRKDGIGEIGIRQRTMRDSRLAGLNCLHVGRTEKIAVCQNTLTPEQPKTIEALGVRYAVASKDVGMFPVTFGTMRLDMTTAMPGHRAEAFKRHAGTGRNETRRNGRLHQCLGIVKMAINIPEQVLRAANSGVWRYVAVIVRTLICIIHRNLADHCALPALETDIGEN